MITAGILTSTENVVAKAQMTSSTCLLGFQHVFVPSGTGVDPDAELGKDVCVWVTGQILAHPSLLSVSLAQLGQIDNPAVFNAQRKRLLGRTVVDAAVHKNDAVCRFPNRRSKHFSVGVMPMPGR